MIDNPDMHELYQWRHDKEAVRKRFKDTYSEAVLHDILRLVADTIDYADGLERGHDWRWSVTLNPVGETVLRVNLSNQHPAQSPMEALVLTPEVVHCFIPHPFDVDTMHELRDAGIVIKPITHGKAMPAAHRVEIPVGMIAATYYGDDRIMQAHQEMMNYYGQTYISQSDVRNAHSPGLLDYLDEVLSPHVMPQATGPQPRQHDLISDPVPLSRTDGRHLSAGKDEDVSQEDSDTTAQSDDADMPLVVDEHLASEQGPVSAARRNQIVEKRALEVVFDAYCETHDLRDVSVSKIGYDVCCLPKVPSERELHIEVKGTTSAAETVYVTRNEVEYARHNPEKAALIVVGEIILTPRGHDWEATGGRIIARIVPWNPSDKDLYALQYRYAVRTHE